MSHCFQKVAEATYLGQLKHTLLWHFAGYEGGERVGREGYKALSDP